jgi:hypothetical protein
LNPRLWTLLLEAVVVVIAIGLVVVAAVRGTLWCVRRLRRPALRVVEADGPFHPRRAGLTQWGERHRRDGACCADGHAHDGMPEASWPERNR